MNAAVPTFGSDLRTLLWQTVNVWWTMIYSERISDELRTFGPQMSSSVPECRDSLINLSTILLSRDQAWNLQVCILLDFTNRALDIQSWWQWLGLLMSVSGDQILQSVNWKYGTWISTRKHKCSWISTSTLTTSLAGFKQSYYIVLSILSFLHRFYPIPLWHFLPKKGNQMQSVYSNLLAESIWMGLHLQAGNLLCRTVHRSLAGVGNHLDPLGKNQ